MINIIWAALIIIGFGVGIITGELDAVTNAAIENAKSAVETGNWVNRCYVVMVRNNENSRGFWTYKRNIKDTQASYGDFISRCAS